MSLVAYGSSDDSEDEDREDAHTSVESSNSIQESDTSLQLQLKQDADMNTPATRQKWHKESIEKCVIIEKTSNWNENDVSVGQTYTTSLGFNSISEFEEDNQSPSLFLSLPPPKTSVPSFSMEVESDSLCNMKDRNISHKKQTVIITVPSMLEFKNEEITEPTTKKLKPSLKGSGLFSLLPAPKNLSVKETKRSLVPHVLTKRPSSSISKVKHLKQSAKLPSEPVYYADSGDESEGEESSNTNAHDFFSLNSDEGTTVCKKGSLILNSRPGISSGITAENKQYLINVGCNAELEDDVPLNISSKFQPLPWTSGTSQATIGPEHPVWKSSPQHTTQSSSSRDFIPVDEKNLQLNEEALQHLCGRKSKRQQQAMELIEVSGDAIMPDPNEWLTKQLTEEQEVKVHSYSHRKSEGPTTQQRRKHQITYLAFQDKENELELKNQWSQNRMSRKQTQSKYGF